MATIANCRFGRSGKKCTRADFHPMHQKPEARDEALPADVSILKIFLPPKP